MANIWDEDDIVRNPCRTCIENDGFRPIFGDQNSPDVSLELTTIAGVHLQINDDLPNFICEECFQNLENAVLFRQLAKRSESILKRKINKLKKKRGVTQFAYNTVKGEAFNNTDHQEVFIYVKEDCGETSCVSKYDPEMSNADINNREFSPDETEIEVIEKAIDFGDGFDFNVKKDDSDEAVMFVASDDANISRKPKNLYCKLCHLKFDSKLELENHRETNEHKRKYIMNFLPKTRIDEKDNKTVHPKDQKCKICHRMFTKLHYPRHMQTQHNVPMITSRSKTKKECPECKKMFHPVALNRHIKQIHSQKPPKIKIECPVCNKFFSKEFYPLHMQRHQGEKNYICDQCGKKFFFKSTLYTHRLIHSNELPHKCPHCPYKGRTKSLLNTHVRTHTGDYPFKCTQCETRCLTKSNLNAHIQRHRGPVDFVCDTCNRGFYKKIDLERHISVIHLGIKTHICNICGVAFGYRHGLMSHQLNVHKRAKGQAKARALYLKFQEQPLLQTERSNSDTSQNC